jgi:hypothetical protein
MCECQILRFLEVSLENKSIAIVDSFSQRISELCCSDDFMLRNYAQRGQFPKSPVHTMHKKREKKTNRMLKRSSNDRILCHLGSDAPSPSNHVFDAHRSIFPKPMMGVISVIEKKPFCSGEGTRRALSGLSRQFGHFTSTRPSTCADRPSQLCGCTSGHGHKTYLPITPNNSNRRYLIGDFGKECISSSRSDQGKTKSLRFAQNGHEPES